MFTCKALQHVVKSASLVLRESCTLSKLTGTNSLHSLKNGACPSSVITRPTVSGVGGFVVQPARHYARASKKKKPVLQSQLNDLPPTMLKLEYAAVPLAQTTDDLVKRLLTLELASHSEKLQLKREQLIAKVQRDETDRNSPEVKVAVLTARIRNYQEHLHKHHKDKSNKRRMLMAIDCRKKILKNLRMTRYDAFENVCEQLGITYSFPPEYYRRITRRWLAKKALCIKVFQEVQKQKAAKIRMTKAPAKIQLESAEIATTGSQ